MTRARTTAVLARAARRRGRTGFTLIELSVALIAGLLVAMALVQVSKEANNTFHEEVRVAAAEMSLRIALERLRSDLQRASYMSTPNIAGDKARCSHTATGGCTSNVTVPVAGISRLAGVYLQYGGSFAATPLSGDPNNGLNPDTIQLGGNFSSTDDFPGHLCPPAGGACGGTYSICLEKDTPSMWRINNTGANAAQTLQSYFNPTFYTNPTAGPGVTRFMARITDGTTGRYHFVLLCGGAGTTTLVGGIGVINIDPNTPILQSSVPGVVGGISAWGASTLIINPVQFVSWQLQAATSIPVAGTNGFGVTNPPTADPNEYVLTRGYVDALTPTPYPPDPATLEVVSEYAVDLKFAFTVDNSNAAVLNPPGAFPPGANPLLTILLDSNANAAWAPDAATFTPYIAPPAPQRIRSVRARLAIRAAAADRIATVAPVPATGQPYLYRYFIPGAANGNQWARVRTGVVEVSLPNQARVYW